VAVVVIISLVIIIIIIIIIITILTITIIIADSDSDEIVVNKMLAYIAICLSIIVPLSHHTRIRSVSNSTSEFVISNSYTIHSNCNSNSLEQAVICAAGALTLTLTRHEEEKE
jgi:hypothetical protein